MKDLEEFERFKMDIFAGLDVGYRDPTAFCVLAYDWERKKYYLVDEYLRRRKNYRTACCRNQKTYEKWDIDYIYIDSAAQQTRFDFAQNYDITTI